MDWTERADHLEQGLALLTADVAILKTDVAILTTDVAVLKTDVGVLKADVAVLKADVVVLKTDTAVIKANYATKADLLEARNSIVMWLISAVLFGQLLSPLLKKFGV